AEGLAADEEAVHLIAKSADGGMRDGLSILDQVLSFGAGPVTAQRVRDVLGLIPEDRYSELLRLVAERDTKAVFPLVDRLSAAGADLGEFVAGAGGRGKGEERHRSGAPRCRSGHTLSPSLFPGSSPAGERSLDRRSGAGPLASDYRGRAREEPHARRAVAGDGGRQRRRLDRG